MPICSAAFYCLRTILNRYTIRYLSLFLLSTNCTLFAFLVAAPQTSYQLFPAFRLCIINILINRFSANAQPRVL